MAIIAAAAIAAIDNTTPVASAPSDEVGAYDAHRAHYAHAAGGTEDDSTWSRALGQTKGTPNAPEWTWIALGAIALVAVLGVVALVSYARYKGRAA